MRSLHAPSRLDVMFDDDHAVANAGLLLTSLVAERLGLEQAADKIIDLGDRPGAARPGRKVLTLAQSMVAGGDCIDDVDVLRTGSTAQVLSHRPMAPSTCGTFLRSFTFGHVRQLDRFAELALTRAWAAGGGPGDEPVTIDVDSTICEVHGHQKEGAAFGYTRVRGLHPLLATRADTGEVLHARMRKGSAGSGRGAERFVNELIARVRRAGAAGQLTLRADSAFWSTKVIDACQRLDVGFSITAPQHASIREAIAAIDDDSWADIDYTDNGVAQVGEGRWRGVRLIVRRTRLIGRQATLWPDWRYHAFVTDRAGSAADLDEDHRRHAVVELAIRDLKEGAGLAHCPSGKFNANAAWLVIAALAHNLLRWATALGGLERGPIVAKTLRRRLLAIPGRITRSARRVLLHLPRHWPWQQPFMRAVVRLRAIPLLT